MSNTSEHQLQTQSRKGIRSNIYTCLADPRMQHTRTEPQYVEHADQSDPNMSNALTPNFQVHKTPSEHILQTQSASTTCQKCRADLHMSPTLEDITENVDHTRSTTPPEHRWQSQTCTTAPNVTYWAPSPAHVAFSIGSW